LDLNHSVYSSSDQPHESPAVIWIPLVLLAIPSLAVGYFAIEPMLFGSFFNDVIKVDHSAHPAMGALASHFHDAMSMALHGFQTMPFFLALSGVALAAIFYLVKPSIPEAIKNKSGWLYRLLENKYYLDRINEIVFAAGARALGRGLWKRGDQAVIDGFAVNGSARLVGWVAGVVRQLQTGYIYHYAFAMLLGVAIILFLFLTMPYVWPQIMTLASGA